jgi:uncharacterized lipoprotein YmbA
MKKSFYGITKNKVAVFMLSAFVLAGCVGTSQLAQFYTLRPVLDVKMSDISKSIGVETAGVPVYLDRPQIVVSEEGNVELKFSEMDRWIEPLSSLIQRSVVDNLTAALPQSFIKNKNFRSEVFDYTVTLEVNKFDFYAGQKAVADIWWEVSDNTGKMLVRKRFLKEQAVGSKMDDFVLRESEMIGDLSKEIARFIIRSAKK